MLQKAVRESPTPEPKAPTISPTASVRDAAERLERAVIDIGPMVVALSGGVDSSLLAVAARKYLDEGHVIAVTADSESLATGERELCANLCRKWDIEWRAVATAELSDARYTTNNNDRCYWCKSALMDQLTPIANQRNAVVTLGVNLDDLSDHRPGQEAAKQRDARFPLVEAELTKRDIRALAKWWNISTWDRPAMPCLSSRLPYGTEVTLKLLTRVDRAEQALRQLGFENVRVRHYDKTARLELPLDQLVEASERADAIVSAVQAAGYRYVTLDLAGLRSGNLNITDTKTEQTGE